MLLPNRFCIVIVLGLQLIQEGLGLAVVPAAARNDPAERSHSNHPLHHQQADDAPHPTSTTKRPTTRTAIKTTVVDRRDAISGSVLLLAAAVPALGANAAYIDPQTDPPVITQRVFLDVVIEKGKSNKPDEKGRLVIGLFGQLMPRTVQNFVALCESNAYAGTTFYRILSDFSIQGGAIGPDAMTGKTGLSSLENGKPFEPDNYNLMHTKAGLVSMVRGVGGAVDSRFYIQSVNEGGWGDDRYAAFGIVLEEEKAQEQGGGGGGSSGSGGMDFVRNKIEKVPVQPPKNTPKDGVVVRIVSSGLLAPTDK